MRIAVSADEDTGVARAILDQLRARGHTPIPRGALAAGDRPDWAWAAEAAATEVADGRADQAIVCCWTGTGASIAANKVPGIRAALASSEEGVQLTRAHNDANVIALGAKFLSTDEAERLVEIFLTTEFDGGARHARRIAKIAAIERTNHQEHATKA